MKNHGPVFPSLQLEVSSSMGAIFEMLKTLKSGIIPGIRG